MRRRSPFPPSAAIICLCAGVAALARGQITSPPPVCFGFNESTPTGLPASTFYVPVTGGLTVHFVAPVGATVERADLPVQYCWCAPALAIDLFATSALGAPPSGPPIATFVPPAYGQSSGFSPFLPASPVTFTALGTYAVLIRATAPYYGGDCYGFEIDPAGSPQLPYQFSGTAACPGSTYQSTPPAGTIGLKIRFRALACGPGPLASVAPLGSGCGENALPSSFPALLQAVVPPALGSTFVIQLQSPFASTAAWLFWSVGVQAAGAPVFPGSSCLHYLDAPSLAALNLSGSEPLIVSPLVGGSVIWQGSIPLDPTLSGMVLGLQALVVGPSGGIPLGGGAFGQTSNALQLLLGY
jgi:hypothetical protein